MTYILFNREMAMAYREGRKTMTRRLMKVQPPGDGYELARCVSTTGCDSNVDKLHWIKRDGLNILDSDDRYFACQYGYPGDQLVFGTTWATLGNYDGLRPTEIGFGAPIWSYFNSDEKPEGFGKLRPGIILPEFHRDEMPRETLKIVRAEKVQYITDKDAILEGIFETPRDAFSELWDEIYFKRGYGWESNPWVWVLGW